MRGLGVLELGRDRQIPAFGTGERTAFYRILLRHQHRQRIAELQLAAAEAVMVGKGMLGDLQPGAAQLRKEALRVADAGHRMHAPAGKVASATGTGAAFKPCN